MKLIKKVTFAVLLVVFVSIIGVSQNLKTCCQYLKHFSFTLSGGSGSMLNDFNSAKKASFGSVGVAYKYNTKLSFGVSMLGTNNVGNEEEVEGGQVNDITQTNNSYPDNIEQGNNNCCCFNNVVGSAMVNATYFPLIKHTFFVQPYLGYSIENKNMAYSFFAGWNQNIFKGLAVTGGLRYFGNITESNSPSFKVEIGVSWNL